MSTVKVELTQKAIRVKGGGQSFKAVPKKVAPAMTAVIDTFEHKKVSAACYKVLVETKLGSKDIFDLNVLAYRGDASYTQYGRIILGGSELVNITVTADLKKVFISATSLSTEVIKISAIPTYIEANI